MEELHQLIPLKPQSHLLGQECLMELGDSQWGVVGLPFPIKVSKCFESLITRWRVILALDALSKYLLVIWESEVGISMMDYI